MSDEQQKPAEPRAFTKVCRRCSVQAETAASVCPNCGSAYGGRRGPSAKVAGVAVLVLLVIIGGVGGTLKVQHDHAATQRRHIQETAAAEATAAKKVADDKAAQQAADQAASDKAARTERTALIKDMQQTITKDAKKDVATGLLNGPILYTSCDPLGGGSTDDLTAITTTFSCIVASTKNDDGTVSGYNFSATMNWDKGSYTWQLSS